jgi:hypothetical protein
MHTTFFSQPFDPQGQPCRFGDLLNQQLTSGQFSHGFICSAYATSGGTGLVASAIKSFATAGRPLEIVVGLGNGVTSAQAVDHLLLSGATVHGFATGSIFIFHPKVYLLEGPSRAWIALGSCNLTSEGLYRNFEVMSVSDLNLNDAVDAAVLGSVRTWLEGLSTHQGNLLALIRPALQGLVSSRLLVDEAASRSAQQAAIVRAAAVRRKSGIPAIRVSSPPHAPLGFGRPRRVPSKASAAAVEEPNSFPAPARSQGRLVWQKVNLRGSDAQRVPGTKTKPVGGLRLTQAEFKVNGQDIDQTTYFRQVFGEFGWQTPARSRTKVPQEEAQISFDVTILGNHLGVQTLRVSHKPSGESGQGNYTTIIHWGPLARLLRETMDIRGRTVRLYAPPPGATQPFSLEVA